jgi:hypothetical protein
MDPLPLACRRESFFGAPEVAPFLASLWLFRSLLRKAFSPVDPRCDVEFLLHLLRMRWFQSRMWTGAEDDLALESDGH